MSLRETDFVPTKDGETEMVGGGTFIIAIKVSVMQVFTIQAGEGDPPQVGDNI